MFQIIGREDEVQALYSAMYKGKNALLQGPLYRGKTHLLYYLSEKLTAEKFIPIYFDCNQGFDERVFLESYSKHILKKLSFKLKNIFEDSSRYLPNIRPKINLDSVHGVDINIDYHVTSKDVQLYIREMMEVPYRIFEDMSERIVILFDEFQLLTEMKNANILEMIGALRKKGVNYVFCSSDLDYISKILKNSKLSETLQLDKVIELQKLPKNQLSNYVEQRLNENGIKATANIIEKIMNLTDGEIHFVKKVLNKLIDKRKEFKRISVLDVSNTVRELISRSEDVCYVYFNSLSAHQKKLMIAIAKEGGNQVFKGEFILSNGLVSVPSVQTSIRALIKKNFIVKEKKKFRILDFVFKEWLQRSF